MGWIDFGVILASPIVSFLTLIFDQTMFLFVCLSRRHCNQCDFIWQFIGLWASFYSLWQQLICPNLLHAQAIFVKVTKSIIFLVKSFLGNSNRHLAIFSGHTGYNSLGYLSLVHFYRTMQGRSLFRLCMSSVKHRHRN